MVALIGWYLMVPPFKALKVVTDATTGKQREPTQSEIVHAVPLSKWTLGAGFDSAEECYRFRTKAIAEEKAALDSAMDIEQTFSKLTKGHYHDTGVLEGYVVWRRTQHAECVASDDPQLK
jgi:hypothetical protein